MGQHGQRFRPTLHGSCQAQAFTWRAAKTTSITAPEHYAIEKRASKQSWSFGDLAMLTLHAKPHARRTPHARWSGHHLCWHRSERFKLRHPRSNTKTEALKNGKTDYDAHCTVGVVIAFPFFRRAGAPYPQRGEGAKGAGCPKRWRW